KGEIRGRLCWPSSCMMLTLLCSSQPRPRASLGVEWWGWVTTYDPAKVSGPRNAPATPGAPSPRWPEACSHPPPSLPRRAPLRQVPSLDGVWVASCAVAPDELAWRGLLTLSTQPTLTRYARISLTTSLSRLWAGRRGLSTLTVSSCAWCRP